MAAKVNTRFVVILTATLLTGFGAVAGLAYWVINKTGTTWERRGDKLAAAGDYGAAAVAYGRAVGHEKNNVEWLRKWDEALSKWAPPTENEFYEAYNKIHLTIVQQIATALQTDAEAHRAALETLYREYEQGSGRADVWEQMVGHANTTLNRLDLTRPEFQSLRRFRGLAQLGRLRTLEGREEERTEARKDLEAAVEADPTDVEAALGLVELRAIEANRVRRGGRTDESEELMKEASEELDALIVAFPGDPRPLLKRWEMRAERELMAAINAAEQRQIRDRMAPLLDEVISAAKNAPAGAADTLFIRRLGSRIMAARPADGAGAWLEVIDAALAKDPGNSSLMLVRGQALAQLDEDDRSIDQFQQVIDLPDPTVTYAGKQLRENRKVAMQMQIERILGKWERASAEDKPALMTEVKKRRDTLGNRIGVAHPAMLRINALLSMAEQRYPEAVRHLSELNNLTNGQDVETLYLLAFALRGEGSFGASVQQYDRILGLDSNQIPALLSAAELELRLEQTESARRRLERALQIDPENTTAKRQLEMAEAILNEGREVPIADPVVQALVEANRWMTAAEPDMDKAMEVIDRALKAAPDDFRLIQQMTLLYVRKGTLEPALALVNQALQRNPNRRDLNQLKVFIEEPDPIQQSLKLIETSEVTALDKTLMKYGLYKASGMQAEAAPFLKEAAKEAPDDPRVVEFLFVEALERNDVAEARTQAARAAQMNIDQAGGLMFQARVEMVERKYDAAISTLGRVTQQLPLSAQAWRLMGQAQMDAGRVDQGLEAFRKAVQFRPNDSGMIRPFLAALMKMGRESEALEVLRSATKRNAADEQMSMLWLELEEAIGDKDKALEVREKLLVTRPNESQNRVALARLYSAKKDWENAAKIIDGLEADEPLVAAMLEARMLAGRDSPDAAMSRVAEFLATDADNQAKVQAEIMLADILIEAGRDEQAFATLRDARQRQDAKRMEADRKLGDILFERGRFEEAVDAYGRVLASGQDENQAVAKRRAEALLRLQKWDEVEAAVAEIEKVSAPDFQTALLLADASIGKGDRRTAAVRLDEAVKRAPNNPMAFYRRALLNEDNPDQAALVVKDLEQATSLRPDFTLARTKKAQILFRRGQETAALTELAEAVSAAPLDDSLRLNYIAQLQRVKRVDDAKIAATEAVRIRAESQPIWFSHAGDVYSAAGDHRGALDFYKRGYLARPAPETVGRVVDCMLRQSPPQGAEAMRVIDLYPKDQAEAAKPVLMILRSRVLAASGRDADAQRTIAEVWPLVKDVPPRVRAWFDQLDEVFKRDMGKMEAFVRQLAPDAESLGPTGTVMLAARMMRDPSRWDDALAMVDGVERRTADGATLLDAFRVRSQVHYSRGEFPQAVEAYKAGLAIAPSNSEFNNNLAYTLARDMNDRAQAMPYAQKAALADPSNPSVLDTLGWLQMRDKNMNAADETLSRALNLATNDQERLPILIHLAEVKATSGDRSAARELMDRARRIGSEQPRLMQSNQAEFDSVNKSLGGAE